MVVAGRPNFNGVRRNLTEIVDERLDAYLHHFCPTAYQHVLLLCRIQPYKTLQILARQLCDLLLVIILHFTIVTSGGRRLDQRSLYCCILALKARTPTRFNLEVINHNFACGRFTEARRTLVTTVGDVSADTIVELMLQSEDAWNAVTTHVQAIIHQKREDGCLADP
ncbi:hypothetical protein J6590_038934 [Homalodisca vitripennis]|nr:hypothetical protein J6590_038934 [Homalodisca vitripennis]